MSLPFNLEKLPPEALDVLRYMGKNGAASVDDLQKGTGLATRSIGKAIRRLVNYDYISLTVDGSYQLTTDGSIAVQQIAAYDASLAGGAAPAAEQEAPAVERRLTVVLPRALVAGKAADLYVGVNPPTGSAQLSKTAQVELKVSAVGGALSASNVSLEIPPDKAARPSKVSLTPAQPGRAVRVRVDAFQALEFDTLEPLGGMYFDVQVSADGTVKDAATRAVGMDLKLKPPR